MSNQKNLPLTNIGAILARSTCRRQSNAVDSRDTAALNAEAQHLETDTVASQIKNTTSSTSIRHGNGGLVGPPEESCSDETRKRPPERMPDEVRSAKQAMIHGVGALLPFDDLAMATLPAAEKVSTTKRVSHSHPYLALVRNTNIQPITHVEDKPSSNGEASRPTLSSDALRVLPPSISESSQTESLPVPTSVPSAMDYLLGGHSDSHEGNRKFELCMIEPALRISNQDIVVAKAAVQKWKRNGGRFLKGGDGGSYTVVTDEDYLIAFFKHLITTLWRPRLNREEQEKLGNLKEDIQVLRKQLRDEEEELRKLEEKLNCPSEEMNAKRSILLDRPQTATTSSKEVEDCRLTFQYLTSRNLSPKDYNEHVKYLKPAVDVLLREIFKEEDLPKTSTPYYMSLFGLYRSSVYFDSTLTISELRKRVQISVCARDERVKKEGVEAFYKRRKNVYYGFGGKDGCAWNSESVERAREADPRNDNNGEDARESDVSSDKKPAAVATNGSGISNAVRRPNGFDGQDVASMQDSASRTNGESKSDDDK